MIFTITTAVDRTVGPRPNGVIKLKGCWSFPCDVLFRSGTDMHLCGNIVSAALSPMCLLQIFLSAICMPLFKLYVKLIYKKEYPLQKVVDKLLSNWYYNHLNTNAKSVLQWMTKVKRKVKKGGE